MKLNKSTRQEIWNDYKDIEFRLRELSDIVQNPIDLSKEDLIEYSGETDVLIRKIDTLRNCIIDHFQKDK